MNIKEIIIKKQGTIVDVRTKEEFIDGNVSGSINIPLQELSVRMNEVKSLKMPLVLCCASGGRSGVAQGLLAGLGIECVNGGSWLTVNDYHTQINH